MSEPLPSTMTREGAEALARRLTAYWHAQGHPQVLHWVEPQRVLTHRGPEEIWVVRSNLVRGMPPRGAFDTRNEAAPINRRSSPR